ncbi:MAG: DUF58 domain-containing protein [Phycisphaeraceae bacterium]|nr:DUF58 domain-containing protein [Phycisphaeraceae bacterium]
MLITPATSIPRTLEELLPPGLAAKIDRLDVFSRRVFAGKLPGERRSKRRGRSVEFDDFRSYVAGDDLRHVDWNVYGRFERLIIKLFREEEDLALHLIVDASASMGAGAEPARSGAPEVPSKSLYAHRLAMALAYIGLVKNNRVSVAAFGGAQAAKTLRPVRGRTSLRRISDFLLQSLAVSDTSLRTPDFNASIRSIASRLSGRGIVVLISDLLTFDAAGGLASLGAAEHGALDAYCLQVLSPSELDPARGAAFGLTGDLRLTDIETARGVEVTVSPAAIARYRENLAEFLDACRGACRSRGVAHFLVPTDTPIDRLVIDSLRRGGMMR